MAKGRHTRHSTLTETAQRAFDALRDAGLHPHPGVIAPCRTGPLLRVVVTPETGRVRIAATGVGSQEILVYGAVTRDDIVPPLAGEFGPDAVKVRDPHGLWEEETKPGFRR